MPAIAAHYKFGDLVLLQLGSKLSEMINSERALFDIGLQGADLLFYHNVYRKSDVVKFGENLHTLSGAHFFRMVEKKEIRKSKRALVYLLGCYCHYVLDRECHPYIQQVSGGDDVLHRNFESDFELAVLRRYEMSLGRHRYIPLTVNPAPIAAVYSLSTQDIRISVRNMHINTWFMNNRSIITVADALLGKGGHFKSLTLKRTPHYIEETQYLMGKLSRLVKPTAEELTEFFAMAVKGELPLRNLHLNFMGEPPEGLM